MVNQNLHLPHEQEEKLINEVAKAIDNAAESPVMFNVWGIGGVGKSTLLTKFQEGLTARDKKIHFAKISFDTAYSTPLDVMVALHKELPEINALQKELFTQDPFGEKYKIYKDTLVALKESPVEGKGKVESDQIDRVKQLTKLLANAGIWTGKTALTSGISDPITDIVASMTSVAVSNVLDATIDGVTSALTLKDKLMDELLRKHKATEDPKVQELMLEPLPKLTQAFIDSLISHATKNPVVLILNTYEKASIDFDTWLRQLFLKHHKALKSSKLRIVTAGRYQLFKKEGWGNFITTDHLVREIPLKVFDKEKSKSYLEKIGISDKREIEKLCKRTNGLPYHLKLIAHQKEQGIAINCDEAIEKLLLVGLTETQQDFVRLVACCRWFDRALIQSLADWRGLDFAKGIDANLNCFDWLNNLDFMEFIDRGRYRLGDVARDAIRLSLTSEQLKEHHARLQKYFEDLADREVPPELWEGEKYENSVWCEYTAEAIYHTFFNLRRDACKIYFLKHFFASRYFKQVSVVSSPLIAALISEAEFDENKLFPQENKKFLDIVKVLLPVGWVLIDLPPSTDVKFGENSLPNAVLERIENSIDRALETVDALPDGLAKWQALICKCHRSPRNRIVDILKKAEDQAKLIENQIKPCDCSNLFRRIGDFFYFLSKYEEAIAAYDKAISLNPEYADAWIYRGVAKHDLKRYEEAITDFDKAIALNPDFAEAWNCRGAAKANLQRHEEAIADLDKAILLNPDYASAWNNRGNAKANLQRHEEAIADYDKAIELNPDYSNAWINRGAAKANLQSYEEAIADFDKAIALNPDLADAWINRGLAKANLQSYEEAIADYDKAISLNPDDAGAWNNRGLTKANLQSYEEAISDYDKAISLNPDDAGAWNNRGNAKANLQSYEEAIADYDKAIALNPDNAIAWNNRGVAKGSLQRYKEAIADFDKVIALNPDDANAWNNRGKAKADLQRYEEAIADLDKAIALNPDDANAWNNRGITKGSLQRYEEAIADLDKAIALDPDYSTAWAGRGVALTRLRQYDQALENFNRSIQLDSNDFPHQINRGVLFAWMGRHEEAIRDCDSFVQSHPNDVDALFGLSCCYALQGNIDESIKYLAQAINQQPEETKTRAQRDPEFNGIREDKRFQDLVAC